MAISFETTREESDSRPPCGICMCPAASYFIHYGDTIK